jgi:hypothetical protein
MRVFVYPEKTYEELGAKRWEVEWYTVKAKALQRVRDAEACGDYDEIDPDRDVVCHYATYPHRAKGLALARAKKEAACELSAYGSATVTEQAVDWYVEDDRIAEWANVGEPIYVP